MCDGEVHRSRVDINVAEAQGHDAAGVRAVRRHLADVDGHRGAVSVDDDAVGIPSVGFDLADVDIEELGPRGPENDDPGLEQDAGCVIAVGRYRAYVEV